MNQELLMNPNCLVAALEKPAAEFTKADIISFIQKNNIRMVNFMYPAADGRLRLIWMRSLLVESGWTVPACFLL